MVTHADHQFSRQDVVRPEDFVQEHLICYTSKIEVLDIFQRVLIPAGVTPKKVSQIQITEAIIEMVKAKLGITVMATWAIKPYLRSKELVTIPVADHALERTWYALTIKQKNEPRYIQWFINHLRTHPFA